MTSGKRSRSESTGETEAYSKPDPYPRKTTLTLTDEQYRALRHAQIDDGINTLARLRALIDLWRESEELAANVAKRAAKERE
jgi:hypothetical protein